MKNEEEEMRKGDLDSCLFTSEDTESPSSDVYGAERLIHSGLEMPMFSRRTMELLFTKCIAEVFPPVMQVIKGQTMSIINGHLLNVKSHLIVETISHEILRTVIPQVLGHGSAGRRYIYVTEGDILHSLGYSLDMGIREVLRLTGQQHCVSISKLKQLIVVEV
ncbi:hypothetical protein JOB18_016821, partial [Solea senegalensis]